jgi:hypothetical protein
MARIFTLSLIRSNKNSVKKANKLCLTRREGTLSTARNSFARKLVFQANLQIRSVVFDVCQKKKNFSKEIKKYFG